MDSLGQQCKLLECGKTLASTLKDLVQCLTLLVGRQIRGDHPILVQHILLLLSQRVVVGVGTLLLGLDSKQGERVNVAGVVGHVGRNLTSPPLLQFVSFNLANFVFRDLILVFQATLHLLSDSGVNVRDQHINRAAQAVLAAVADEVEYQAVWLHA